MNEESESVGGYVMPPSQFDKEPTAKQKKAWAKKAAHKARKIAKTDQREARIREIVREELDKAGIDYPVAVLTPEARQMIHDLKTGMPRQRPETS